MFCGTSYNDKTRSLFHDANSKRGGVLMHTKVCRHPLRPLTRQMLIATFEPASSGLGAISSSTSQGKRKADDVVSENEGVGGWIYVGSHNFSPSAWVSLCSSVCSSLSGDGQLQERAANAEH